MDTVPSPLKGLLPGVLVSIDIETTGLDADRHDVLEVAAIAFCLNPENTTTQSFHAFIKHGVVRWDDSTFDFHMKNDYFNYVRSEQVRNVPRMEKKAFAINFLEWLIRCGARPVGKDNKRDAATAVGKNFGSFDLQFLNNLHYEIKDARPFKHRALDLGNLLWNPLVDGVTLPSSEKCAERMGYSATNVRHRAMDDATIMMHMCRKAIVGKITARV